MTRRKKEAKNEVFGEGRRSEFYNAKNILAVLKETEENVNVSTLLQSGLQKGEMAKQWSKNF